MAMVIVPMASAQEEKPKSRKEREAAEAAAEAEAPKADYSKEFRKLAGPVQTAVNEKKWADVHGRAAGARGPSEPDARRQESDRHLAPPGDPGRRRPGRVRRRDRGLPRGRLCRARERRRHAPPARRALQRQEGQREDARALPEVRGWDAGRPARRARDARPAVPAGRPERGGLPDPRQGDRRDQGQGREAQGNVVPAARPLLHRAEGRRRAPREPRVPRHRVPGQGVLQPRRRDLPGAVERRPHGHAERLPHRRQRSRRADSRPSAPTSTTRTRRSSPAARARPRVRSSAA